MRWIEWSDLAIGGCFYIVGGTTILPIFFPLFHFLSKKRAEWAENVDIGVMEFEDQEKGSQLLQLFARHNRALRAYSRLILPSVDPIDDVMQESSIVIWEKQDQLRHEDEFLPWAKTIVRNISFRHRRKLIRDRHVFDDDLVERLLTEEDADQADRDHSSREYGALMTCLNKLPEERKQLMLAPYRSPGAVKEIADKSTRSPNSLYKLLQRLRAKLMHCVETELNSDPVTS